MGSLPMSACVGIRWASILHALDTAFREVRPPDGRVLLEPAIAHRQKLLPALRAKLLRGHGDKRFEHRFDRVPHRGNRRLALAMGAAQRLRHDGVDDTEPRQILLRKTYRMSSNEFHDLSRDTSSSDFTSACASGSCVSIVAAMRWSMAFW